MNYKKALSLALALILTISLFSACGDKEKEIKNEQNINPALTEAFGEEMIASEEENIQNLVSGLEECYKNYEKSKDIDTFAQDVNSAMTPYKGYLEEISAELMNLYEDAKADGNKDKMTQLLTIHSSSIRYIQYENTWSMYKMCLDTNMEPWQEKDEVEDALIEYINAISEFFYCKPVAE